MKLHIILVITIAFLLFGCSHHSRDMVLKPTYDFSYPSGSLCTGDVILFASSARLVVYPIGISGTSSMRGCMAVSQTCHAIPVLISHGTFTRIIGPIPHVAADAGTGCTHQEHTPLRSQ